MANINVVNLGGAKVGEFELLDELFAGEVNEALLWEAVKHYRAALRQGTAATKNRKNVSGAGSKLWKQKGTGRARVGSIRTPALAWWRNGPRTSAAPLRLPVPEEEADGRASLGDRGEDRRRQVDRRRDTSTLAEARPSSSAMR